MKGVTPILSAIALGQHRALRRQADRSVAETRMCLADVVAHFHPQVLAWAYDRPNGGRGFGFTGFHVFANLTNDSFRTTLLNGIAWVSGLEVPADGVPSTTPTKDDLEHLMDEAQQTIHGGKKG